jgi:choline dehydrogenase-like flavoprotein
MPVELGGVVYARLVVHGTSNLRVVDASIFPITLKGNILSSVYAVAEKGRETIREDHARVQEC